MTNREQSSRTCLITSMILLLFGVVILSPEAGVACFLLSILLAIVGVCLAYKRYGKRAILLIIIGIALTTWRLPDARKSYNHYMEKVNASIINNKQDS
jgi:hypothetical protein